jgi:histidinol dehydrogenase
MSAVRRVTLQRDGAGALAHSLSPPPPDPQIAKRVHEILADVRARGDDALVEATRRFDCPDFTHDQIRVPQADLAAAAGTLDAPLREAFMTAIAQVRALAAATRPEDVSSTLPLGQRITVRALPVSSAGIYVPGGRAAYPSSLIMGAVPAQVAGVERIAIVTPPGPDGRAAPVVLATASLLGIDEVAAVGGPAAIGALAFGTDTIAPVAVIAGPGSAWVQEAKRQVFGTVGIDGIAGPSEVVIVAAGEVEPAALADDLLAQAEHGPDSPAILVSPDASILDAVEALLRREDAAGAITLVHAESLAVAVDFAEAFAPEHLELAVAGASSLAGSILRAGAVFTGPNGGTAFGDYIAGSNHILPTGGAARFASAVGPSTFMRRMSVIDLPDDAVTALTPHLAAMAQAEGFPYHRRSAEVRADRIAEQGATE